MRCACHASSLSMRLLQHRHTLAPLFAGSTGFYGSTAFSSSTSATASIASSGSSGLEGGSVSEGSVAGDVEGFSSSSFFRGLEEGGWGQLQQQVCEQTTLAGPFLRAEWRQVLAQAQPLRPGLAGAGPGRCWRQATELSQPLEPRLRKPVHDCLCLCRLPALNGRPSAARPPEPEFEARPLPDPGRPGPVHAEELTLHRAPAYAGLLAPLLHLPAQLLAHQRRASLWLRLHQNHVVFLLLLLRGQLLLPFFPPLSFVGNAEPPS